MCKSTLFNLHFMRYSCAFFVNLFIKNGIHVKPLQMLKSICARAKRIYLCTRLMSTIPSIVFAFAPF